MGEDEFWSSTLYELTLLMDRRSSDVKFRAACAGAKVEDEHREQSMEEQFAAFSAFASAHNGRIQAPDKTHR